MVLRKAAAYSKKYARPYTRKSAKRIKSYIKTIPPNKVVKFHMGAIKDFDEGKLKFIIKLVSGEKIMIRDNSLEACRQHVNRLMDKEFLGQHYFTVKVYPHHLLRENRALTGAGADRMSSGMQKSFGSIAGRAAMVKEGQEIFVIATSTEKARKYAFKLFQTIKAKLPCHTRVVLETLK